MSKKVFTGVFILAAAVGVYALWPPHENRNTNPFPASEKITSVTSHDLPPEFVNPPTPFEDYSYDELLEELYKPAPKDKTSYIIHRIKEQGEDKAINELQNKIRLVKGQEKIKYAGLLAQFDSHAAIPAITELLKEDDPAITGFAAIYLCGNGDESVIKPLLKASVNASKDAGINPIDPAIKRMPRPKALKGLLKCLNDENEIIAYKANESLVGITGEDFGYAQDKKKAVGEWTAWIERECNK